MTAEALLFMMLLVVALRVLVRRAAGRGASAPPSAGDPPMPSPSRWFDVALRDRGGDGRSLHVGVCELEGFEGLRRHIGFKAANAVMSDVATRIGVALPSCTIGRTGRATVEFAWFQADADPAERAIEALHAGLPPSFELEGCSLDVRPRIAFQRASAASCESMLELIDATLADAARHHLDTIRVPEDDGGASDERLYLLKELSAAITGDRLTLHYQPKLDCRSKRIAAVEALLRWSHDALGEIGADRVIKAAEETGLIRRLTIWVLRRALRDLAELRQAGLALPIYVNISGALLPDERFAATVIEMIGDDAGLIGFEITETAVIRDPDRAMANLERFRAAGIGIAIDDYGSGLSSLAYLKRLPAQELKIDKLFISGLTSEHRDPLLVRSSIDLAHALEMKVTAEGVDNPMALSLLTIMGCDMAQGYLIARPLALAALIELLGRESHVGHIQPAPAPLFGARAGHA